MSGASTRRQVLHHVREHYDNAYAAFGPTAQGVDWRDAASQRTRFEQAFELCSAREVRSVCDLGSGYGALLAYLRSRGFSGRYTGVDLSSQFTATARELHVGDPGAEFLVGAHPVAADAVVASGIFNVALEIDRSDWEDHVWTTIREMWACAHDGIAFNLLSTVSDPARRAKHLYYAEPASTLARALSDLTPHVELKHHYGLFEFTLIARRRAADCDNC